MNAEETIGQLEKELEETILLGEEADRKYEEVNSDCLLLLQSSSSVFDC
jgi:hypothetical protein